MATLPNISEKHSEYLQHLSAGIEYVIQYKEEHGGETNPETVPIPSSEGPYELSYEKFELEYLQPFYLYATTFDSFFKNAFGEFKPQDTQLLHSLLGEIHKFTTPTEGKEEKLESDPPGVMVAKLEKAQKQIAQLDFQKEKKLDPLTQSLVRNTTAYNQQHVSYYINLRKRLFDLYGSADVSPRERLSEDKILSMVQNISQKFPIDTKFDTVGEYERFIGQQIKNEVENAFAEIFENKFNDQEGKRDREIRKKVDMIRTDSFVSEQSQQFFTVSHGLASVERQIDRVEFDFEAKKELYTNILFRLDQEHVENTVFVSSLETWVDKTTIDEPTFSQAAYQALVSANLDAGIPINKERLEQIESISTTVASLPIVPITRLPVTPEETSIHTEMKDILTVTFKNSPLAKWMEAHPQGAQHLIADLLDIQQDTVEAYDETPRAGAELLTQHIEQVLGRYVPGITHTRLPDTIAKKLTEHENLSPNDIQTSLTQSFSPSIGSLTNPEKTAEMSQIIHQAIQSLPTNTPVSEQYLNTVITYAFDHYDIPLDEQTAIIRQSLPTLRSALVSGQSLDTAVQTLVNQLSPQIEAVVQKNQTQEDKNLLSNTLSSRLTAEQDYIRSLPDDKTQSDYIASLVTNEVDIYEITPLSETIVKKNFDTEDAGDNHGLHFPEDHENMAKPLNKIIKQQIATSKSFEAALANKDGTIPRFYFASISNSNGRTGRFFGALLDVVGGKGMLPYYLTGDKEAFNEQQSYLCYKQRAVEARIQRLEKQGGNQKTLAVLRERRNRIVTLSTSLAQIHAQARPSFINRWLYQRWQKAAKPQPFSFKTINQFISPTKPFVFASYPSRAVQIARAQQALAIANKVNLKKTSPKPQTVVVKKGGFRTYLRSLGTGVFDNRQRIITSLSSGIRRLLSATLLPLGQFITGPFLTSTFSRTQLGLQSINNADPLLKAYYSRARQNVNISNPVRLTLLLGSIFLVFIFFFIFQNNPVASASIQNHVIGSDNSPNPQIPGSNESYWLLLHRKSQTEVLYKGTPGSVTGSTEVRRFNISSGQPGKRPTPLPRLYDDREYWVIHYKLDTRDDPRIAPRALVLKIPFTDETYNGPVPYNECPDSGYPNGQCKWGEAGWFGLHGVGGNRGRIDNNRTHDNDWSNGCIQHFDDEITYLYDLLGPLVDKGEQIRYYVEDD